MRWRLVGAAVSVLVLSGSAMAEQISTTITCGKAENQSTAEVGDAPGHMVVFSPPQKCSYTGGSFGGVKMVEGQGPEFDDVQGNETRFHGYWTETYESGDKVFYRYEGTGTMKEGMLVSAKNTWAALGGTGKMKGASGKGTCTAKGDADGAVTWSCKGNLMAGK